MTEKRIGMVGAGWVADFHLPAWAEMAHRAKLVAICDPNISVARSKASAFGISEAFASAEEMIASMRLDALDIASPRETHPHYCRLAADNNLAILCQKPLAPTFDQALSLTSDVSDRVPMMINENWRFRPWYRRMQKWISTGNIGPLRHVRFDFLSSGMIPDGTGRRPALVRQPMLAKLDRLLVMEIMIHHLDTLRFLIGEMTLNTAKLLQTNTDIIGEDVATLELHITACPDVRVHMHGNLATPGAPSAPRDQLRIIGRDGTIAFDGETLALSGARPKSDRFDPDKGYRASYSAAIAHFLDGLEGAVVFETGPADNLETLRLAEDAYRLSGFQPRA